MSDYFELYATLHKPLYFSCLQRSLDFYATLLIGNKGNYVALTQHDLRQQHAVASPLNTLVPQRQRVRDVKKG